MVDDDDAAAALTAALLGAAIDSGLMTEKDAGELDAWAARVASASVAVGGFTDDEIDRLVDERLAIDLAKRGKA